MQFSWVRQLRLATEVVVMRCCRVMVFEKTEAIDKTGGGLTHSEPLTTLA